MRFKKLLAILMALGASLGVLAQVMDEEVLKKADEARFIDADSFTFILKVIAERMREGGVPAKTEALLKVFNKRFPEEGVRIRVEFLEPENLRGTVYLVVGEEIFFWQPGLLQPIKISGQQKLFGDASVAEAAGIQFRDYSVSARENVELEGRQTIKLELHEKTSGQQAFPFVTLWLDSSSLKPVQVFLRALSEEPLKKVTYPQYAMFEDDEYAAEIVVEDLLFAGNRSTMQVGQITLESLDEKLFDPNQLGK